MLFLFRMSNSICIDVHSALEKIKSEKAYTIFP